MQQRGDLKSQLDVWVGIARSVNYEHVLSRSDIEWRATRDFGIDGLLFEAFHGGGDKSWAPRRSSYALFGDISMQSLD